MKYYPLELIDKMQDIETPDALLNILKLNNMVDKDISLDELVLFVLGDNFFKTNYIGKFKKLNDLVIYDKELNRQFFPQINLKDIGLRMTEWKDVLTTSIIVGYKWSQFKMVYKIDNDFYHEISNTDDIYISYNTFKNLPFNCFFIDLTDVENISGFKGVFVYVQECKDKIMSLSIYMVKEPGSVFFTYYALYDFNIEDEVEFNKDLLPKSDFIARSIDFDDYSVIDKGYVIVDEKDPRNEIVISIYQLINFISLDASDINENESVKRTYKPRKENSEIKNKFSEVRMWDVGVRYGKAIRVAKQKYKETIDKAENENANGSIKDRKPVRPHVRRPHWQRYHCGKGRKDTKRVWIGPIYVCGSTEIPVTIREIKN